MKYGKMIEIVFPHGNATINIKKICKERSFGQIKAIYDIMIKDAFNYKDIIQEIISEINELIEECEYNNKHGKIRNTQIIKRCNKVLELIMEGD